jgi:hypothetical protein
VSGWDRTPKQVQRGRVLAARDIAARRGTTSPARQKFTVPLFGRKNLQKFE